MRLVLSCLLSLEPSDLQLPVLETKHMLSLGEVEERSISPAKNDWELEFPKINKPKLAASEMKRIVEYMEYTRDLYVLKDIPEINPSKTFQFLHFDLRQVIETNLFLPRVSVAENSDQGGSHPLGRIYHRLKTLRQRIYQILLHLQTLAKGDNQRRFVIELIFTNGCLDFTEVELCCPFDFSCSKFQLKGSLSIFWQVVSYQLGRDVSRSLSTRSEQVAVSHEQIPYLLETLKIFSLILSTEFSSGSNWLAIILSVALTVALTASWPESFHQAGLPAENGIVWESWAIVEIVYQHIDYIVGLANYFENEHLSHHFRSFTTIRYLNRPLFGHILGLCVDHDVAQFLHVEPDEGNATLQQFATSILLEQIFSLYHSSDEFQQQNARQACQRVIQCVIGSIAGVQL
jgi:hypothetical protein